MHVLLDDPWVKARIEAALAPYRGRLSTKELDVLRDQLAEVLVADERAAKTLRRARPRENVDVSGEAFVGGMDGPANKNDRAVGE